MDEWKPKSIICSWGEGEGSEGDYGGYGGPGDYGAQAGAQAAAEAGFSAGYDAGYAGYATGMAGVGYDAAPGDLGAAGYTSGYSGYAPGDATGGSPFGDSGWGMGTAGWGGPGTFGMDSTYGYGTGWGSPDSYGWGPGVDQGWEGLGAVGNPSGKGDFGLGPGQFAGPSFAEGDVLGERGAPEVTGGKGPGNFEGYQGPGYAGPGDFGGLAGYGNPGALSGAPGPGDYAGPGAGYGYGTYGFGEPAGGYYGGFSPEGFGISAAAPDSWAQGWEGVSPGGPFGGFEGLQGATVGTPASALGWAAGIGDYAGLGFSPGYGGPPGSVGFGTFDPAGYYDAVGIPGGRDAQSLDPNSYVSENWGTMAQPGYSLDPNSPNYASVPSTYGVSPQGRDALSAAYEAGRGPSSYDPTGFPGYPSIEANAPPTGLTPGYVTNEPFGPAQYGFQGVPGFSGIQGVAAPATYSYDPSQVGVPGPQGYFDNATPGKGAPGGARGDPGDINAGIPAALDYTGLTPGYVTNEPFGPQPGFTGVPGFPGIQGVAPAPAQAPGMVENHGTLAPDNLAPGWPGQIGLTQEQMSMAAPMAPSPDVNTQAKGDRGGVGMQAQSLDALSAQYGRDAGLAQLGVMLGERGAQQAPPYQGQPTYESQPTGPIETAAAQPSPAQAAQAAPSVASTFGIEAAQAVASTFGNETNLIAALQGSFGPELQATAQKLVAVINGNRAIG